MIPAPAARALVYLDGQWSASHGDTRREVDNPATEQVLAQVCVGDQSDVDRAVDSAASALPRWAATAPSIRAGYLRRLAAALNDHIEPIGALITAEVGTPTRIATRVQVGFPATVLSETATLLDNPVADQKLGNSIIVREPVGVVAAITPWNYPVHQVVAKLAGALAAGCTMVVKPSEVAPLSVYALFELIHAVGFPPGVVNLVPGDSSTGAALATHENVDAVSFTGSVGGGSAVARAAAGLVKRVTLELGGKSANVVLPDGDLTKAVKVGVANANLNAGQTCTAWTRLLVSEQDHDQALALAASAAATYVPGDPTQPGTRLGPLISAQQRERVTGFIDRAIDSGARMVAGSPDAGQLPERGYFVPATVFGAVDPSSELAQQEVFGPVLAVIPYRDEADALAIANNCEFGLHGAVWSGDQDRAVEFARGMQTGMIDINGAATNSLAPFGGYKRSGVGKELGPYGIDEFTQIKAIQI